MLQVGATGIEEYLLALLLRDRCAQCIVACFLGNATRNCVGLGFGRSHFTLTNTIFRTYNVFGRILFSVTHPRTDNLGEVPSALLGAQLSSALVGCELTGLQVQVILRLTVGQSVSKSWCRVPSGAHDQIFITGERYGFVFRGAPSLTIGQVCLLYMLLALASAVFFGSESLGTRGNILLPQI
jgi:hypothetical protein